MLTWIAIGLVVGFAVLFFMRSKGSRKRAVVNLPKTQQMRSDPGAKPTRPKKPEVLDKFKGIALVPQKDACAAAMKMRGKTLPEGFMQQIPVPGCDRQSCECKISEVRGRRGDPRRTKVDRRDNVRFSDDRRKGRDRREGVDAWNRGGS